MTFGYVALLRFGGGSQVNVKAVAPIPTLGAGFEDSHGICPENMSCLSWVMFSIYMDKTFAFYNSATGSAVLSF